MSDLVLVAATSASSAVLGVLVTSLASIFGPAWQARAARRHEVKEGLAKARRSALDSYIDAVTAIAFSREDERWTFFEPASTARNRLSSVLTIDESPVQAYASGILKELNRIYDARASRMMADRASDELNDWLRGGRGPNDLRPFGAVADSSAKYRLKDLPAWP